jgi:hypothetical protein
MPDQDAIAALVDRIVDGARIPRLADREDLRRELWTHFEDAGAGVESTAYAIRRFGEATTIADSLRQVYRWEYVALHLAKIVASVIASLAAAVLIIAAVNLRVAVEADVWRLAPGFSRAIGLALAIVVGLVAASEALRRPISLRRAAAAIAVYAAVCGLVQLVVDGASVFATAACFVGLGYLCSRVASGPMRWLATIAAFAVGEYALHAAIGVSLAPRRAVVAGAILGAVWASTLLILRSADRAFVHLFDAPAG